MRSNTARISGVAFVAVLGAAQIAAIAGGVFQERDEVGDADDVDGAGEAVVVVGHRRQHHVAAIGAAIDHDAPIIEAVVGGDPIEQRADVAHAVFAQRAVVEGEEILAVAFRAAHVRRDHGDAEFVDPVLDGRGEAGAILALGPAVDVDDDRMRARRARAIEEAGDLAVVERAPADQFGIDEGRLRNAAGFALRPAREAAQAQIPAVDIAGRGGAVRA